MKTTDLTPVEIHNNIYYKRDDYYAPYGKDNVNGGKTRQAICLFRELKDEIKNKYNGGVVTGSSVNSPQAPIIAAVAQDFGFKCVIGVGGTTPKTIDTHHMMRLSRHYGADIENVAGHGYTVAIDSGLKKKVISKKGYMLIKFGNSAATNPESIFDSVANQVENIPDKLDNIVISVGSGIQFAGIVKGIEKFKKKVKRIIGVTFVDRSKKINEYLNQFSNLESGFKKFQDYEMYKTTLPNAKPVWEDVGNGFIDDIYEGKAHKWMRENIDTTKEKTLFWIIGRRLTAEEVDKLYK